MVTVSKCHTLDRQNYRAHKEQCGYGNSTDGLNSWKTAVDAEFNITHWPYLHDDTIYNCLYKILADSYYNLN